MPQFDYVVEGAVFREHAPYRHRDRSRVRHAFQVERDNVTDRELQRDDIDISGLGEVAKAPCSNVESLLEDDGTGAGQAYDRMRLTTMANYLYALRQPCLTGMLSQ
jgi:hypothetical protein